MSKVRIAFLIPTLGGGGAERTLVNMLSKIDYDKYDIDLIVFIRKGIYLDQIPQSVNLITLFNDGMIPRLLSHFNTNFLSRVIVKTIFKFKVKKGYDLSISFLDSYITDFLFFIKNVKKRYTWVHSSYRSNRNRYPYYSQPKINKFLRQNRYQKLDGIFFVSNDARKEFVEVFGTFPHMKVVYNIINKENVLRGALESKIENPDVFYFVAIGSLIPVKGYDKLIEAANILNLKGYNFKIDIIGEGNDRVKLEKLIKKYNLDYIVGLKGFQKNPYPFLNASDVFVMTSLSEAFPTVLCEAMILGKPVITTDCSGCRELIANGNFGLMAQTNAEDIAELMGKYLNDNELLNKYAKLSKIRSALFEEEKILTQYQEIFDGYN